MQNLKSITVKWEDDLVPDSYKIVLPSYNVECVNATQMTDGIAITVLGNDEDVERFNEDYEDDAFEMLDTLSLQYKDDDEYVKALTALVEKATANSFSAK